MMQTHPTALRELHLPFIKFVVKTEVKGEKYHIFLSQ